MNPVAQQPAAASPAEQLLAQLQGPALPDPVSAWPPAPGWWIVAVLTISAIVISVAWLQRQRVSNRYRKTALQILNSVRQKPLGNEKIYALKALLKQTYFSAYPNERNRVAALHGAAWLRELHRCAKLHKLPVAQQTLFARYFSDEIYQSHTELCEAQALQTFEAVCQFWIKKHASKIPAGNTQATVEALAGGTN